MAIFYEDAMIRQILFATLIVVTTQESKGVWFIVTENPQKVLMKSNQNKSQEMRSHISLKKEVFFASRLPAEKPWSLSSGGQF